MLSLILGMLNLAFFELISHSPLQFEICLTLLQQNTLATDHLVPFPADPINLNSPSAVLHLAQNLNRSFPPPLVEPVVARLLAARRPSS